MRSVVVVLPASMWAMIPMLRVFWRLYLRGIGKALSVCLRAGASAVRRRVGALRWPQRNGPFPARIQRMETPEGRGYVSGISMKTDPHPAEARSTHPRPRADTHASSGKTDAIARLTRADTRARRPCARRLPAVVGEGLVGLRHAEDVVLALVRAALLRLRVHELVGEPLRHRLLTPVAGELDEPAHGEGAGAALRDLHGHLVGRAADPAGFDLEHGRERLDRSLQRLHGVLARALGQDGQRVVHDPLGSGLLAVEHQAVDHLLHELGAVHGIRLHRPLRGCGAARHGQRAFTPYCERAFLRSETPAASSVPRTTL